MRPPTLGRKVARLIAASMLAGMLVFCLVAYLAVWLEDEANAKFLPEADDDPSRFFLMVLTVAAPISLAMTIPVTLWLARRTLRPVDEVVRAARAMSADRLDRRIPEPEAKDELHELVRALNELFARLERGFEGLHSFAADVSHELRTPLAVVISELEVASRKPRSSEEWREAAGRALASLRRMVAIVEALLELARGGLAERREEVPLVELAEEITGTFAARATEAGVTLAHVSTGDVTARVNRGALGTALAALVANAVRYTPRGGRVEVRVAATAGGAELTVDDAGPGVPEDERGAIFAPLVRGAAGRAADAAGHAEESGLGLGLAIVRRVVDGHGGSLTVGGSPLGGARFTIALPRSS